jgi:ketosteroid isomerase-like protein
MFQERDDMSGASKSDLIRAMFTAYHTRDREAVERTFADGFTFTSPYDDAIDKAAYFERCWPGNAFIAANELERIFEQGDEAFVTYQCRTNDGKTFRNTEFFTFDGDRVKNIDVYFGATYKDGVFVRQPN